jgi:uncharacterized protein (TIGR03435 family)
MTPSPFAQRRAAFILCTALACAGSLPLAAIRAPKSTANSAQSAPVKFDAVTIKTEASGAAFNFAYTIDPTHVHISGVALDALICDSYGLSRFQLTGRPQWVRNDRFDIEASVEKPTSHDGMKQMLRQAITDKFQLVLTPTAHTGTVYSLQLAEGGSKLGHQPTDHSLPSALMKLPAGTTLPIMTYTVNRRAYGNNGESSNIPSQAIRGTQATMADLAGQLANVLGAPVTDDTGLQGKFDFTLHFDAGATQDASDQPGIADALKTQLGLHLTRGRGTYTVYTIKQVEKPAQP